MDMVSQKKKKEKAEKKKRKKTILNIISSFRVKCNLRKLFVKYECFYELNIFVLVEFVMSKLQLKHTKVS